MIDGTVARTTNSTGEFGAKIDTLADIFFTAASSVKLLPIFRIPLWLLRWIILIAIIKLGNIIKGYILRKRFISMHTIMNKITGSLLFLSPLTVSFVELKYSSIVMCSIATFSAIQEWFYITAE